MSNLTPCASGSCMPKLTVLVARRIYASRAGRTRSALRTFLSRRSCPRRIAFHARENGAVVRAALSAAAGHQFRSVRHPDFRAALEHTCCGGLAGKQFGDRRSPHLYARGPRRPAGVGQDDLYRDLSRHCRTCGDVAKIVTSRCCGSDG
jgi:hypothetical protein